MHFLYIAKLGAEDLDVFDPPSFDTSTTATKLTSSVKFMDQMTVHM